LPAPDRWCGRWLRARLGAEAGEASPWLSAKTLGPGEAKGIVYFVHGYAPEAPRSFQPMPHYLRTLSEKGWDMLAARVPLAMDGIRSYEVVTRGAAFMRRRVRELKAQGYKRVVLAGHSWGAWVRCSLPMTRILPATPCCSRPQHVRTSPRR
jgi:triacylglycerol esterase/lipase EstA (alpha/beta hydrolase family)